MINLEKSPYPTSQIHALLPLGTTLPDAECFHLAGNRTSVSCAPAEQAAGHLQFAAADPDAAIPARQGKFSDAERDNILCLLASPDGRFGSIRINANAQIYTCQLGAGHQILYRIKNGHALWLRATGGEIELDGVNLCVNHSATVSGQSELTITALSDSEFLLLVLW